jgi:hypothetical protein
MGGIRGGVALRCGETSWIRVLVHGMELCFFSCRIFVNEYTPLWM